MSKTAVVAHVPETLMDAVRYYADQDRCRELLVMLRWPDGVHCPTCGTAAVSFLKTRKIWKCSNQHDKRQFSVKVGTVMEDSPISLDKWFVAMWVLCNCKNGVSSYELARDIKVTQKTAWFMLHRLRLAMQAGSFEKLGGEIEADETYVGGKARFMSKSRKARKIKGRGTAGKAVVMGLLERHGEGKSSRVKAAVITNPSREVLGVAVRNNVTPGSTVNTDEHAGYVGIESAYAHNVINHAEAYVKGSVHTNGIENFWSLLKRSIKGTYVSVEPFHLFRYVDEQSFRFNNRKTDDAGRFIEALASIFGRRLTYKQLIGEAPATT